MINIAMRVQGSGDLVSWFGDLLPNRFFHTHADWQSVGRSESVGGREMLSLLSRCSGGVDEIFLVAPPPVVKRSIA